jgi:hypothetical protein
MLSNFQEEILYNIASDVLVATDGLRNKLKQAEIQEAAYTRKAERSLNKDDLEMYKASNLKALEWRGVRTQCQKALALSSSLQGRLAAKHAVSCITPEFKDLGTKLGDCLLAQDTTRVASCLKEMLDLWVTQERWREQQRLQEKKAQKQKVETGDGKKQPLSYIPAVKTVAELDAATQTLSQQFARDTMAALKQPRTQGTTA